MHHDPGFTCNVKGQPEFYGIFPMTKLKQSVNLRKDPEQTLDLFSGLLLLSTSRDS